MVLFTFPDSRGGLRTCLLFPGSVRPNKRLQLTPRAEFHSVVVESGGRLGGPALAVSALGAAEPLVR